MKKIASVVFALMGVVGVAHADILAGGPAYPGSASGGTITCRIFNAGVTSSSLTSRQIFDNTGAAVALTSDSCAAPLPSTKTCAFSAAIAGNLAYSCRLITSGPEENLRGTVEVFASPSQFFELPLTK